MTKAPALQLDRVTLEFGALKAVSDVSFDVAAGARHGVIGPNGAGKTTLFNVISGELAATHGRIVLFGGDVTRARPAKRVGLGLGRTYQITRTFTTLTVRENVALSVYGLRRTKFAMFGSWRGRSAITAAIDETAERFDLRDRLDTPASDLSHGELRQLEVALAVSQKPRLLLLDEPGAGLSPGERVSMAALLRQLPEEMTIVMIEHDMDIVREVVQTVSVLHHGELVMTGETAEVQRDERVRRIYLGETV